MLVAYYVLLALVTLAGFSVSTAAMSFAVAIAWPHLRAPLERLSAARRARWLLTLRLTPSAAGLAVAVALAVTFLLYEPPNSGERAGGVLGALAAIALAGATLTAARTVRLLSSDTTLSRLLRHCRQWTSRTGATATVLDTAYPVAAVAGVLAPRLMLSVRVLEECSAAEIDAIVAHERAHMRRRDNLARALVSALPDRWLAPRANAAIETAWIRAAEEAADGEAAGQGGARRAALAATLIHVARMADRPAPEWMPQLAFYQGADLEHRVRTLLAEPRRDAATAWLLEIAASIAAVVLLVALGTSVPALHHVIEWNVRLLP